MTTSVGEHVDKMKPACIAAATLENNLAVLPQPSHSTSRNIVKRNESIRLHKNLYVNVQSSKIRNSQKAQTTPLCYTPYDGLFGHMMAILWPYNAPHTMDYLAINRKDVRLMPQHKMSLYTCKVKKASNKRPHSVWFHYVKCPGEANPQG